MNNVVIIVAGGSGLRMKTEIPKQFMILGNKPVLQHTIEKFYFFNKNIKIILVLPENHIEYWKKICMEYSFSIGHQIVTGGKERFFSVKNAVDTIKNADLVAIHDGVRPCVALTTIENTFKSAAFYGNAIPSVSAIDSVRIEKDLQNFPVDRKTVKLIQTPQIFKFEILKKAYNQPYNEFFTDDASVVEKLGEKIHLVEGNRSNLKITTVEDFETAKLFLKPN